MDELFSGHKILIVEDSYTQAEKLKIVLETRGFKPSVAKNGTEAFDIIRKSRPSLIISDIIMPVMDGYEMCMKIKNDEGLKDIPVMLLTSLSDPMDIIKGLQCGADNFHIKPYSEDAIIERIQSILVNHKMRKLRHTEIGIATYFSGEKYIINSDRIQILDLLFSTYEDAVKKNKELEKLNEQLLLAQTRQREQNIELQKLIDNQNQFLGMAAHDLRNPIFVIRECSKFLLRDDVDGIMTYAKKRDFIQKITSGSEFMSTLVDDLLDITKIAAGTLELDLQKTDLVTIINNNVAMNTLFAKGKEMELVFNASVSSVEMTLDSNKIEQLLNNLISNAIKYSKRRSTVEVNLSRNNKSVLLFVKDMGQGIPDIELQKLFQPFSKTSIRGTEGEKSTGLGLAIAQKIAEGHNGRIWVDSTLGKGSTFYVSLPIIT